MVTRGRGDQWCRVILALELRATVCGWSLLDEATSSFEGLGVHALGRVPRAERSTLNRVDRSHGLARVVAARAPGCSTIVLERWDAVPDLDAGLAWGSVLGVVAMLTPRPVLLTVEPERWKRDVLLGKRDADADMAYANAAYVLRGHPRADQALRRLPVSEREPAIAAAMVALHAALRLGKSKRKEGA